MFFRIMSIIDSFSDQYFQTENKMYRKIPHRFVSVASASGIILSVLLSSYQISAAAEAAPEPGISAPSGEQENAKTDVAFFDVGENDWFYDDVIRLAKNNIVRGFPDGGFHPERNITNAEFIKMLVMASGASHSLPSEAAQDMGHWAQSYISLARDVGILTEDDVSDWMLPDAPMKRSNMAKMISGALHIAPDDTIKPFEDSEDPYAAALYRAYIVRGVPSEDGKRYNFDGSEAKRSEAAAIISRIMSFLEDPEEYKKNAVLENASQYELKYEFELVDLFRVLNREFISDFVIKTPLLYSEWIEIYKRANVRYLEDFYATYLNCEYVKNSNTYKLYLDYGLDKDTLMLYRKEVEAAALAAVEAVVSDSMSDTEKIRSIHDYIILNCSYDYQNYQEGSITYDSRLAYGALCQKRAVCQGYTAAFNLMARQAGIETDVVTGKTPGSDDTHVWNKVVADGQTYYVDVTHDDPVPDQLGMVSYRYFMLSEDEMLELGYSWQRDDEDVIV